MNALDAAGERQHRREVAHDRGDRQRQGERLEVLGAADRSEPAPAYIGAYSAKPSDEVDEERGEEPGRQAGERRRRRSRPARGRVADRAPSRTATASAGTSTSEYLGQPGEPDADDLAEDELRARSRPRSGAP